MPATKHQVSQKSTLAPETKAIVTAVSASKFSDDEIRTRAYQIYEFRNRTAGQASEDWSQAEMELTELVKAV